MYLLFFIKLLEKFSKMFFFLQDKSFVNFASLEEKED